MAARHYHIIFNPAAGTARALGITTEALAKMFTDAGLSFDIDDDDDLPLEGRIARALAGPADVVVAGGGDGTVLAVAEALLGSDKVLAVLPLGTLNGLARDLQLALNVQAAVAQLAQLEPRAIDIGEVNGRPFLHNVIIGLIPGIAIGRELMRGHSGLRAKLKFLRFMARRMTHARRIALTLQPDDGERRIEVLQTLVVANNSYDQKLGRFMARRRLDRGSMTAYLIRSLKWPDAIRLGLEMIAGRWREDQVIEYEKVRHLMVTSKRKRVLATIDGEVTRLSTPLLFAVRPKSLQILAPVEQPVEAPLLPPVAAAMGA
jgi:diacylglycerol kinase family enzyme